MGNLNIHANIDGLRVVEIPIAWLNSVEKHKLPLDARIELRMFEVLKGTNLLFLKDIQNLETLTIFGKTTFNNLELPSSLQNLNLGSVVLINPVAFDSLPNLHHLFSVWPKNNKWIHTLLGLQSLTLMKFNESDLTALTKLKNLTSLKLSTARIADLQGIIAMTKLTRLTLARCIKLIDIDDISFCKALTYLEIQTCKKIVSYEKLGHLDQLEELRIEECAPIADLDFLMTLPKLKRLSIRGTNVVDGQILKLLKHPTLKWIDFGGFKHFDCTPREWHSLKYPNQDWTKRFFE